MAIPMYNDQGEVYPRQIPEAYSRRTKVLSTAVYFLGIDKKSTDHFQATATKSTAQASVVLKSIQPTAAATTTQASVVLERSQPRYETPVPVTATFEPPASVTPTAFQPTETVTTNNSDPATPKDLLAKTAEEALNADDIRARIDKITNGATP